MAQHDDAGTGLGEIGDSVGEAVKGIRGWGRRAAMTGQVGR